MEPPDMYEKLFTVHSQLCKTQNALLSLFCLNHKNNGGTSCEKKALSNILKASKEIDGINSIRRPCNKKKIYETKDLGVADGESIEMSFPKVKSEIEIYNLDPTVVYELLTSIHGFPTYQKKLSRRRWMLTCKNPLHQQCCIACNHKCKTCGKKECKDEFACHKGLKCNHECHNCNEMKKVCLHSSSVCCKRCNMCTYCGLKTVLNVENRCDRLKVILALEFISKLTQLLGTLTMADCKNFLNGVYNSLATFPMVKNWSELQEEIIVKYLDLLNFMSKPEFFSSKCKEQLFNQDAIKKHEENVNQIFDDVTDKVLLRHADDVTILINFYQETNGQNVEQKEVLEKISELKAFDSIQKEKELNPFLNSSADDVLETEDIESKGEIDRPQTPLDKAHAKRKVNNNFSDVGKAKNEENNTVKHAKSLVSTNESKHSKAATGNVSNKQEVVASTNEIAVATETQTIPEMNEKHANMEGDENDVERKRRNFENPEEEIEFMRRNSINPFDSSSDDESCEDYIDMKAGNLKQKSRLCSKDTSYVKGNTNKKKSGNSVNKNNKNDASLLDPSSTFNHNGGVSNEEFILHINQVLEKFTEISDENRKFRDTLPELIAENDKNAETRLTQLEESLLSHLGSMLQKIEGLEETMKSNYQEMRNEIEDLRERQLTLQDQLNQNINSNLKSNKKYGLFASTRILSSRKNS